MAERRRLPDTRNSVTKKIVIKHPVDVGMGELDIYVTVGLYDDGNPGELFMKAGKMGGMVSGLLDTVGICMSLGLQHGVPLEMFTGKLKGMRFEPEGGTNDDKIRYASSMIDAVMRWMERKFLTPPEPAQLPPPHADLKQPFPDTLATSLASLEALTRGSTRPDVVPGLVLKTTMAPPPAPPEPEPVKPEKKVSKLKMHRKRKPARREP